MEQQPSTPRRAPTQMPSDMEAFNRKLIEEFRANGGQLSGAMAQSSLILLTTKGARSGEPRTVVIGYAKAGDRYVAIASGNGMPEHPAWYRNLMANPTVTVEVGPEKFEARATTAAPDERDRLAAAVPWFESQQKLTSRQIPIVVLTRSAG